MAIKQAEKSYATYIRDDGCSTLEQHIYPVTLALLRRFHESESLEEILITGLLHDAMEDDWDFTMQGCLAQYGDQITSNLQALTKSYKLTGEVLTQSQKAEFYKKFINVIEKAGFVVQVVKMEDRLNNLACIKFVDHNPEKYTRYCKEVVDYFIPLAQKIYPEYVHEYELELRRLTI